MPGLDDSGTPSLSKNPPDNDERPARRRRGQTPGPTPRRGASGGAGVDPIKTNPVTGRRNGGPGGPKGPSKRKGLKRAAGLVITPELREAFLANLREMPMVRRAALAAGIKWLNTLYDLRNRDPEFDREWRDALRIGYTRLEDEAVRRGVEGTERPVFHKGEVVGHVREYSDTMLMFVMKAVMPEKYRDAPKDEASTRDTIILSEDDKSL